MNNDNQARELVRELLSLIPGPPHGSTREYCDTFAAIIARADAYLATPAGGTERPSDAQFYSLISTDLEESACTTESAADANIMREAAGLLVRADREIAELRSRPPAKEAEAAGDAPFAYVYEWDCGRGVHRSLRPAPWNGRNPSRAIAVYTRHATTAPGEGSVSNDDWTIAIADGLAREDGYDPSDKDCGLFDVRWSGGASPEPLGTAWEIDYMPRAERIATTALESFANRRKGGSHE